MYNFNYKFSEKFIKDDDYNNAQPIKIFYSSRRWKISFEIHKFMVLTSK